MSTDSVQPKSGYWAGFDLGGTKMLAKIFDSQYKTLGKKRRKTKGHAGVELGLERMAQTIHQALEEAGLTPAELAGIGVGCPGPLDLEQGIIFEGVDDRSFTFGGDGVCHGNTVCRPVGVGHIRSPLMRRTGPRVPPKV